MARKYEARAPATKPGDSRASELFLDTIGLVIDNIRDNGEDARRRNTKEWRAMANRLQLVSIDACRAWREVSRVHLKVADATPPWLWKQDAADARPFTSGSNVSAPKSETGKGACGDGAQESDSLMGPAATRQRIEPASRVPKLHVTRITWEWTTQYLSSILFPPHLTGLIFHWGFNEPIDAILLPEGLQELEFRGVFDKTLPAKLPASIKKITFGLKYNQPVKGIRWPSSLQHLTFGHNFDQTIDCALPASLKIIHFGENFQKSLSRVKWPAGLEEISLSTSFSEPLREVNFPQGLRRLTLAGNYLGQLDDVQCWPPNLTAIQLDGDFNQPIADVSWPPSLQHLSCGFHFNQPIENVEWPLNLKELCFGGSFAQPVERVILPDHLESIAFLQNSSQTIQGLKLPTNLKTLTATMVAAVGHGRCLLNLFGLRSKNVCPIWKQDLFRETARIELADGRRTKNKENPDPSLADSECMRVRVILLLAELLMRVVAGFPCLFLQSNFCARIDRHC